MTAIDVGVGVLRIPEGWDCWTWAGQSFAREHGAIWRRDAEGWVAIPARERRDGWSVEGLAPVESRECEVVIGGGVPERSGQ